MGRSKPGSVMPETFILTGVLSDANEDWPWVVDSASV
jgi:hypothetical protein